MSLSFCPNCGVICQPPGLGGCIKNAKRALAMTTATNSLTEKLDVVPHLRVESESILENSYYIGEKIGQGSFGKVYKVIDKRTGERWAMKCIGKQKSGSAQMQLFEREVAILKRVKHKYIIMLKEVYETHDKVFLIMEYCGGGELGKQLTIEEKFDEAVVKKIMSSLVSAISYLHKCDVVHRDLKLSNILISEEPNDEGSSFVIKVTDFGLSVIKEGVRQENMLNSFCGTLNYMAPEIAENRTYSQQCDVWAMGVIAYQLFCGYPPFCANDEKELINQIKNGKIVFRSPDWDGISNEAKDFILKLLHVDPSYRLTASEALQHPWFTGIKEDTRQSSNVLELMTFWQEDLKKAHLKKNTTISESNLSTKEVKFWGEEDKDSLKTSYTKESKKSQTSLPSYTVLQSRKKSVRSKDSDYIQELKNSVVISSRGKMSKKKNCKHNK